MYNALGAIHHFLRMSKNDIADLPELSEFPKYLPPPL